MHPEQGHNLSSSLVSSLQVLCQRYAMANAHPYTLDLLSEASKRFSEAQTSVYGPDAHSAVPVTLTCVCRYHPVFRRAFTRALTLVKPPAELGIKIWIAWKNTLPCVSTYVNKHNVGVVLNGSARRDWTFEGLRSS